MVKVGERYRHYKSTGGTDHTYEVLHIGFFNAKEKTYDEKEMVVYKPLYYIPQLASYIDVIVRPRAERDDEVEWEGKTVKRFTKI